jgi:hypothetical protein
VVASCVWRARAELTASPSSRTNRSGRRPRALAGGFREGSAAANGGVWARARRCGAAPARDRRGCCKPRARSWSGRCGARVPWRRPGGQAAGWRPLARPTGT